MSFEIFLMSGDNDPIDLPSVDEFREILGDSARSDEESWGKLAFDGYDYSCDGHY